jgi:hypothetical protein
MSLGLKACCDGKEADEEGREAVLMFDAMKPVGHPSVAGLAPHPDTLRPAIGASAAERIDRLEKAVIQLQQQVIRLNERALGDAGSRTIGGGSAI